MARPPRFIFNQVIEQKELDVIRDVTNQSRVLGNHLFKQTVEKILNCKVDPKPKGGDRKSPKYKEISKINLL